MLRIVFCLSLCLASFLATASWIGSRTPDQLKLRWFQDHKDTVDVIFLGSSHVLRQCDPGLFDRERGVAKGDARALNLGLQWMGLPEELHLLQRILDSEPQLLRWVVVEARPFLSGMPGEERNDFTARRIDWHAGDITAMLLQELRHQDLTSEEKWDLAQRHVEHWWRRTINLGRGVEAWNACFEPEMDWSAEESLGQARDGYFPLSVAMADELIMERRQRFLDRPGRLRKAQQDLAVAGDGGPADRGQLALVRRMESLAAEHGVGLIWWLHPGMERLAGWRQLLVDGEIESLLAYDDPARYPDSPISTAEGPS
ncbi:MAG: hypothetical protein ACYSU1_05925 [Planctomycetota bacterium]|jgi:hypothetical protein